MAEKLGMDALQVASHARTLSGYSGSLEGIAEQVSQAGFASQNPTLFGLIPGVNLVMTGGSILLAQSAAADVRAALASAAELTGKLFGDIQQQIFASSAEDGSYILGFMSAADAQALYDEIMRDPGKLSEMSAAEVAAFWQYLSQEQSDQLVKEYPLIVGNTSGVPLVVRGEANRQTAIDILNSGQPISDKQRAYLEMVEDGDIMLVTFDPDKARIVEAINYATWDGENFVERPEPPGEVITYVPGTLSNMEDFYSRENYQNFVLGLIGEADSVAFVYKDGFFPGEHDVDNMPVAILEASDQQLALDSGVTLANFHDDVMRDPLLNDVPQTIIGHSWGLANITASEIAGAQYDNVISLAGAYMPDGWEPNPETDYGHYSYNDWLEAAHRADHLIPGAQVGSGDFPGDNGAFDSHIFGAPDNLDLMGNHELIHDANSPSNEEALDAIRDQIYG